MIYEAIKAPDSTDNEYSSFKKENRIRKINAKGQVYVNNIDENEARRRALEEHRIMQPLKEEQNERI